MYVFAHVGFTLLTILFLSKTRIIKKSIDYRLVVIGSMLPDIIDKPLNLFSISAGRGYAHTLVFFIILYVISRHFGKEEIAYAHLMHLFLDGLICSPGVLFWPFYGYSFDSTGYTVKMYVDVVCTNVKVQVSEAFGLGAVTFFYFYAQLYKIPNMINMMLRGTLSD